MLGPYRDWALTLLTTLVLLQLGRAQTSQELPEKGGEGIEGNVPLSLEDNEAVSNVNETLEYEAIYHDDEPLESEPVETCNGTQICVRKCCKDGEHFDEFYMCIPDETASWSKVKFIESNSILDISHVQVIHGFPPGCDMDDFMIQEEDSTFRLLPDGKMKVGNHSWFEPPSRYCLENRITTDSEEGFFCPPIIEPKEDGLGEHCPWHSQVYPPLMAISCFFLILTMAVYAAVPKLRARTYGRCLLSLISALLIFYFMQIANYIRNVKGPMQCLALAFFSHVNGLAIFFWLNVMAFELWRTVNSPTPITPSVDTFLKYSVYAWCSPFILGFITLGMDNLPESYNSTFLIRPNFAGGSCGLEGKKERWAYLYWVIVVITLVNVGFFAHICYKVSKARSRINKSDNNIWMFAKMFLVMGIPWILDVFSTRECLWFLGDIFNLLQGVGIFIATVCNKFTFTQLMEWLSPRIRGLDQFYKDVRHRINSQADPSTAYTLDERSRIVSEDKSQSHVVIDQDNLEAKYVNKERDF